MSIDPYSAPANHGQTSINSAQGAISQGIVDQLAGTKPWVRFISVLMFIGAGFMLLAAVIMLVAGGAMAASGKAGGMSGGMLSGMAILYGLMSFIYIYPALKLWKYASGIGALLLSGSMLDLETALGQQRSFWKFMGIMIIVCIVLYFVAIIAMVAFGGFAAMQAQGMAK